MNNNLQRTGAILVLSVFLLSGCGGGNAKKNTFYYAKVNPTKGTIRTTVSTTGAIEPRNRLEIKPPISGRIDSILVKEGSRVKKGQTLAWISSTDRAALLDAARTQGADAVKHWEEVYKATPLIAPIDGEVIDRSLEPGQTISATSVVLVLSDQLIVKANVDETDIGKVKIGQKVEITSDAYPDQTVSGYVEHIAYESTIVSNVTTYEVDIRPSYTPGYFRSGMGTNVEIITAQHKNALLLQADAIQTGQTGSYVLVPSARPEEPEKKEITTGLSDDKQVEILSGLTATSEVLVKTYGTQALTKKGTNNSSNPFMPKRPTGNVRRSGGGMPPH